jgi:hypothetical protein
MIEGNRTAEQAMHHLKWDLLKLGNVLQVMNNQQLAKLLKATDGNDVHVSRVFSDYVEKEFTSTNEYITWMYSR